LNRHIISVSLKRLIGEYPDINGNRTAIGRYFLLLWSVDWQIAVSWSYCGGTWHALYLADSSLRWSSAHHFGAEIF